MGAMIAITRADKSAKELRELAARTRDARIARRLLAIALVMEGADRASAARAAGMDRQTLRDWVHRYNVEGVEGLADRKARGAEPRLTAEQKRELALLVESGPDPKTDGVVRWRRVDLKKKIEAKWGVRLHERSVGKVLKTLGYVRLSTRPQHPKADEAAQEAFKKTSPGLWPNACPGPRPASHARSGFRMRLASASKGR